MIPPFPDRTHFSLAFPAVPQPVVEVWARLSHYLGDQKCLPKTLSVQQLAGHREEFHTTKRLNVTPEEFTKLIDERKLGGFWFDSGVSGRTLSFRLLHAKTLGFQSVLGCYVEKDAKAPNGWNALIEALMERFSSIGGWQWRQLYQSWQSAIEINSGYMNSFGSPPSGYSKTFRKTESLTPQPDRVFIDISLNPGRPKELLPTVEFYPTAEMWLGPHFWPYAKCTKAEALAAGFWLETRDTPHYTYFKCWPTPFTRPDGEQGRMQQRLWKLFFDEDCEWPPGSGGISDVPVGGPPELMP